MSWLSKKVKKAKSAVQHVAKDAGGLVKTVAKPATDQVAKLDPLSSKSVVGKAIGAKGRALVRQGIATSTVAVTGGAVLLAKPGMTKDFVEGVTTGAMVGGAVLAGKKIDQVATGMLTSTASAPAPKPPGASQPARSMAARLIAFAFPGVRG